MASSPHFPGVWEMWDQELPTEISAENSVDPTIANRKQSWADSPFLRASQAEKRITTDLHGSENA
jgi:hypothetical protein